MTTAEEQIKALPTEVLSQAARGEIDLNEIAHYELAQRGLNRKGEDVGDLAAMQEWKWCWGGA
jgi:hypothetical protein